MHSGPQQMDISCQLQAQDSLPQEMKRVYLPERKLGTLCSQFRCGDEEKMSFRCRGSNPVHRSIACRFVRACDLSVPAVRLSTQYRKHVHLAAESHSLHEVRDKTGRRNKAMFRGIPSAGQLPHRGVATRMGSREQIK
jgi:hypothetical protein